MINLEPDPDDLQLLFDYIETNPRIKDHYEGIILQKDKRIKELEGIIESIKQDCSDKPY